MNLAIFYKNTNELHAVIRDAVKISDREYRGKKGSITFKPWLYDVILTNEDLPDMKQPTNEDESPKTIMDHRPVAVPIFDGVPVDSQAAVNVVVKAQIAKAYDRESETKIIRLRLSGKLSEDDWNEYDNTISQIVNEGRKFKALHFKEDDK